MTNLDTDDIKILCVYFSREKNIWQEKLEQDKSYFSEANPTKNLSFTMADDDPEAFKNQIKDCDVVYMRGGDTELILNRLKKIENFKELLQDKKIVSGSSAGACALSKYYHTGTIETDAKIGLNVLDMKIFVHYSDDKKEELEKLQKIGEDLPIYKVEEEKFVVINK